MSTPNGVELNGLLQPPECADEIFVRPPKSCSPSPEAGSPEPPSGLPSPPTRILLVEDNPGDRRLIREAFCEAGLEQGLSALANGEQALAYLSRAAGSSPAVRPDLILLDLNLPGRSGFEVLREIKRNPSLQVIPVIILSSSNNPADVWGAYRGQANSYVVKPAQLDDLLAAVQTICDYWLGTALLPGSEPIC